MTELDIKIKGLYNQGVGQKRIAKEIGATEYFVSSRIGALKLKRSTLNYNPAKFNMRGKAKLQNVIYREGMKL